MFLVFSGFAKATDVKSYWAVRVFDSWKKEKNLKAVTQPHLSISPILPRLLDMTKDQISYSLSRFIMEAKKQNGEDYPAETLYELIISIQLYLEMQVKSMKVLNEDVFLPLKNTLDNCMKQLSAIGKTIPREQADIITEKEEELLLSKGILGKANPAQLVDTLLDLIGLHFVLCAGKVHRNLCLVNSQLSLHIDIEGKKFLQYIEDTSKNRQGGLKHPKITPKQEDAYENTVNPARCIVAIYEAYISHRPDAMKPSITAFYLRPLGKPVSDVWFSSQL